MCVCMLTLSVHSFAVGEDTPAPQSGPTAVAVLAAAREHRSVWTKDFPGFKADAVVTIDGETKRGKLKIDAAGSVELAMPDSKPADWARDQFESMVQHRKPDGQVAEGKVVFADDDTANPQGRKIMLGDDRRSSYRIKNNAIMEVTRGGDPLWFTISVLEVQWNPEKKYLPRSFVINYFDTKSGQLRESRALPQRVAASRRIRYPQTYFGDSVNAKCRRYFAG